MSSIITLICAREIPLPKPGARTVVVKSQAYQDNDDEEEDGTLQIGMSDVSDGEDDRQALVDEPAAPGGCARTFKEIFRGILFMPPGMRRVCAIQVRPRAGGRR